MAQITLVAAWLNHMRPRLPLGVLYLAGELLRKGHEVEVRDCQLSPFETSAVDLITRTLQGSAGIVGISCMSDSLPAVLLAVTKHKEREPDSTIILGGPGPTSVAKNILLHFPAVDYIVMGEGEITLSKLVRRLRNDPWPNDMDGIYYRQNGVIYCANQQTRIKDLDTLHPLPYSLVPWDLYSQTIPISTARGCTYGCSFCDVNGIWQRKITQRSVDNVIAELQELYTRGVTRIGIVDDTFVLNRRRVQDFCHKLVKARLPISWHCNGRINLIDDPLLETMAGAGCESVFFGIESGSDTVLQRIGKGFDVSQVLNAVKLSARYISLVTISFIWGFPFETMSDFQQTRRCYLNLAEMNNVKVQIYELTPFPNTPIYQAFSSELYYDPQYVSDLNGGRILDNSERILIEEYPYMFPNFYRFRTPHRTEKLKIISADKELFEKQP